MHKTFRFAQQNLAIAPPRVDTENAVLYGVTAMQAGIEATGHGCTADRKTLLMMADLAKGKKGQITRQRFGHPGISENTAGKQVAVAKDFRVQGDRLIHDSYLMESARLSPAFAQDPVAYILDIAQNSPTEFGESVVINAEFVWVLKDGRELDVHDRGDWPDGIAVDNNTGRPIEATTDLPVIRPTDFYYCDFVGEGALCHDGLFPPGGPSDHEGGHADMQRLFSAGSSAYAEELFHLADQFRSQYNIPLEALPGKLTHLLAAYTASRSRKETLTMSRQKNAPISPKPAMSFVAAGAEKFEEEFAEVPLEEEEEEVELQPEEAQQPESAPADPLAQAESMASAMQVRATAQPAPGEAVAFADMREAMASLSEFTERLEGRLERQTALLVQAFASLQELERRVLELSGQKVVTQKVSRTAVPTLDDLPAPTLYNQPRPSATLSMSGKPTHVSQRRPDGSTNSSSAKPADDPATVAAKRKQELARTARLNTGSVGG